MQFDTDLVLLRSEIRVGYRPALLELKFPFSLSYQHAVSGQNNKSVTKLQPMEVLTEHEVCAAVDHIEGCPGYFVSRITY